VVQTAGHHRLDAADAAALDPEQLGDDDGLSAKGGFGVGDT
jgi:hypothetical protein